MLSNEQIVRMSREAAQKAAALGVEPALVEDWDLINDYVKLSFLKGLPNLGVHCPAGWKRVNIIKEFNLSQYDHGIYAGDNSGYGAFFVDGYGSGDGPAMGLEELMTYLKEGYGYALVEEGEFQVKVGVFKKV